MEMYGPEEDRIVFIEYSNDRPFAVVTDDGGADYYDFDWCKSNEQLYYHCSGGGGSAKEIVLSHFSDPSPPLQKIWAAEGVGFVELVDKDGEWVNVAIDAERVRAMGYEVIDKPLNITPFLSEYDQKNKDAIFNPFDAACESETEYCSICDDRFPDDSTCRHLFWSDDGGWSGVGSDEGKIAELEAKVDDLIARLSKKMSF